MSLLLDALKKAEKAKDEAKRRAQLSDGTADDTVLQIRTRDELPHVSRPLEIHSEDTPAEPPQANAGSPVPDAFSTAPPSQHVQQPPSNSTQGERLASPRLSRPGPAEGEDSAQKSAQRAAAKNVFEAKFREPNPKLPFYITLSVLSAFALGTVVYFWYQLRPPPPLINANPKPPSGEKKLEAIQPQPEGRNATAGAAGAISGLPAEPARGAPATAGMPIGNPVPPSVPPIGTRPPATIAQSPAAKPTLPSQAPTSRDRESALPRQQNRPRTQPASPDQSKLSVNRSALQVNPKIESGWLAYNRGDLAAARTSYQAALRDEPANRDALLGMAALEVRANRLDQAAIYYQNILQNNPRDSYAQAGLLTLRSQVADPVQTESRVKSLLAVDPEAQVLHFSLGNQYSQQGRWAEAQQAYFKAYSAEPENPDFAYNLAVSLDHVGQPKLALEYYRRALSLAQGRASNFDQALVRTRVQELAK